jgi:hypothetical protein
MRSSIVFTGFGVIIFGLLLWIGSGYPIEIIGTIGLINIILGIVTPKAPGLDLQPEQVGPLKLNRRQGQLSIRNLRTCILRYEAHNEEASL